VKIFEGDSQSVWPIALIARIGSADAPDEEILRDSLQVSRHGIMEFGFGSAITCATVFPGPVEWGHRHDDTAQIVAMGRPS